jgi:Ca-activated chloride channel family protein
MTFGWPNLLLSLLSLPLFILIYWMTQRRRQRFAARYGNFGLLQEASGRALGARRHLPAALYLAGLVVLMFALARPYTVLSLPAVEGTIILAFDVSGSMAAEDLQPTRMEAAKAAARAFVELQPAGVLVGVVAFSDGGFTVQAPTEDRQTILATIDRLSPQRGTSVGQGIYAALNTIEISLSGRTLYRNATPVGPTPTALPPGSTSSAVIVLLTDGENTGRPDPLAAAQQAADRGVRIHTIGIGSPAGATIEVEGFMVHTQLNEALLRQIAQITQGQYFNAANEEELRAIYTSLRPQLVIKPEATEITAVFAGAGIALFLLGGLCSLAWFGRWP